LLRFGPVRNLQSLLPQDLKQAVPLSTAAADIDRDGSPDLLVGYPRSEGGVIALLRVNPGVMRMPSNSTAEAPESSLPDDKPFFADVQVIETDLAPDFLAAGDFDADGLLDVVAGERASDELVFLTSPHEEYFSPRRRIKMPGRLTALAAGDVNRPDGLIDIVAGVEIDGQALLLVFEGPDGALRQEPEQVDLGPGEIINLTSIALDDEFGVDIVAALKNDVVVIQGRDRQLTRPNQLRIVQPPAISVYPFSTPVSSIAGGNFLGGSEPEIAVLLTNGALQFLVHEDEELTLGTSLLAGPDTSYRELEVQARGSTSARLIRLKALTGSHDDLALAYSSGEGFSILTSDPQSAEGQRVDPSSDADNSPFWLQTVIQPIGAPSAVLPLRINGDGLDDLVVLTREGALVLPTEAGVTLTVNNAGSDLTCQQPAKPTGPCTIRGALAYVNTHLQDAPFQINITVPEIILQATGTTSTGTQYIPPLTIPAPVTIDGNGVVIKGVSGFNWGSASTGEKDAVFHLYRSEVRNASNSTIRDVTLDANGSFYGIYVENVSNITIENCRFGSQGTIPGGIHLIKTTNSTIRGNEFHRLSRAGVEIRTTSSGIQVLDNYFGADKSGALPASSRAMLDIGNPAQSCTVQGNQFAGISDTAIRLGRVMGYTLGGGHLIKGNTIGLNPDKSAKVANVYGIRIAWHPQTTIEGNVIAGNSFFGVSLETSSDGAKLTGNYIGTNGLLGSNFGNGEDGVVVEGGKNLEIGGDGNAGNVIAFNGTAREGAKGVYVANGLSNGVKILGNSIHSNRSLGIGFFSGDEVTPNDPGDADTGPNNLQNFPVLTRIAGGSDIDLTLDSTPNSTFTIQVFANDGCDPSGYGEGQSLIDSFELQTVGDGTGLAFLQGVPEGKFITATATDSAGNTSEFSKCAAQAEELKPFVVNTTGDAPDNNAADQKYDGICSTGKKANGSSGVCNPQVPGDCECTLRAAIQESNATPGKDRIHFSIPGAAEQSIAPQTPLPPLTAPVEIDGTTQPGYVGLPPIELAGQGTGDGLRLSGGNSTVRGLVINRFDTGIRVDSSNNVIRGNFIGMCHGGAVNLCASEHSANTLFGVFVSRGTNNLIGGSRPSLDECSDPCNVVSSNRGTGIVLMEGNQVKGNFIGTDRLGRLRFANRQGISIRAQTSDPLTLIGGSSPGEGNLISGNGEAGIAVTHTSQAVRIEGNRIGTASDGIGNLGNGLAGISYLGGSGYPMLTIGGTQPGGGNRIAFNKVGIQSDRPVVALSNEIFSNSHGSFAFGEFEVPVAVQFTLPGVTTQDGSSRQISAPWSASTVKEFPLSSTVLVQLFRSGGDHPCEAVELLDTFSVTPAGDSEKTKIWRRSVIAGEALIPGEYVTATVTVPNATIGTSQLAGCVRAGEDSDGDGISNQEEEEDWNRDGIPDWEQASVGAIQTNGKKWTLETNAGALGAAIVLGALEDGNAMHAGGLLDLVISNLGSSSSSSQASEIRLQGSAATVTLTPEPDPALLPVYLNYGPTPADPETHSYVFMYDGATGAEFSFEGSDVSQIVLHFVDGQRGDHDLQENGIIVTRGGVISLASQLLYPLQISSSTLFSGIGTSNFSDRNASLGLAHFQVDGQPYSAFSNPAGTFVEAKHQEAKLTSEIFEFTPKEERTGWVRLVSDNPDVAGLLLVGGGRQLDGTVPFERVYPELYFTRLLEGPTSFRGRVSTSLISLVNPGKVDSSQPSLPSFSKARLDLLRNGSVMASADYELSDRNAIQGRVQELLGTELDVDDETDVLRVSVLEGRGLIGTEFVRVNNDATLVALNAAAPDPGSNLFSPQMADLPGAVFTSVKLVNTASEDRGVVLTVTGDSGFPLAPPRSLNLGPLESRVIDAGEFQYSGVNRVGSLKVASTGPGIVGDVLFGDPLAAGWAAALPLQSEPFTSAVFSQVANIPGVLFTGLALFNPQDEAVSIQVDVYSNSGVLTGATTVDLGPGERISNLLSELIPVTDGQVTGSIRLTSTAGIYAQELFGDFQGTYLSAVPPKVASRD